MAKRKNVFHSDEVRRKIQTSQLVNRLENHIFKDVVLEATQIKAIEILLRKSLPDLSAVTVGGDNENPLTFTVVTGVPRVSGH